jgi:hypothetical protein
MEPSKRSRVNIIIQRCIIHLFIVKHSSWLTLNSLSTCIDARTRTLHCLCDFSGSVPTWRPSSTATLVTGVCSRWPPARRNPVPARGTAASLCSVVVNMRGMAVVFCIGMLDGLEGVCALILLLSESFTRVAVCEIETLLLTVKCFHEHRELLALGCDEVEFLGGGGMAHGSGVQAAGSGEGVGLHVTGAGHGRGGGGDRCNGAREHAVEV